MKHVGRRTDPKDIVTLDQIQALVFRVENIPATAVAQTTFVVPGGYTPGAIMVFLNGVLLQPADYAASASPNVVLTEGTDSATDVLTVGIMGTLRAQDDSLLATTVAGLPSASANAFKQRWCTNMAGGAGVVVSNGTNWVRVADNTLVTT